MGSCGSWREPAKRSVCLNSKRVRWSRDLSRTRETRLPLRGGPERFFHTGAGHIPVVPALTYSVGRFDCLERHRIEVEELYLVLEAFLGDLAGKQLSLFRPDEPLTI
jgi:hypothetical protein